MNEHVYGYSSYTKKFSDIKLVHFEKCPNKIEAERREKQLKGWTIAKKKALIGGDKNLLKKLSKSCEIVDK